MQILGRVRKEVLVYVNSLLLASVNMQVWRYLGFPLIPNKDPVVPGFVWNAM